MADPSANGNRRTRQTKTERRQMAPVGQSQEKGAGPESQRGATRQNALSWHQIYQECPPKAQLIAAPAQTRALPARFARSLDRDDLERQLLGSTNHRERSPSLDLAHR